MKRLLSILILTSLLALGTGCASKQAESLDAASPAVQTEASQTAPAKAEIDLDDYDDFGSEDEVLSRDPLEGWNRFWFGFNDGFIRHVLKPAHKGYSAVVPETLRNGISNFKHNIAFPARMLNFLLQGEFAQAGIEFSKAVGNFMVTLGFGDVTSLSEPLFPYDPEAACFDHTLAVWGVPDGPYFIAPFLGPGTVRSTAGFAGDAAMKPQNYMIDEWYATLAVDAYLHFNDAGTLIKAYDAVTENALEPYVAMRNAYLSQRMKRMEKLRAAVAQ